MRVRACGLNHLDIFVRRGMPGFPVPMPFISGGDIAGEIAELGPEVGAWKVGDRVVMHPVTHEGMMGEEIPGGMAEYVRVSLENLIRLPDSVGFDIAAAVPIALRHLDPDAVRDRPDQADRLDSHSRRQRRRRHRLPPIGQDDRCHRDRRRRLRREMRPACKKLGADHTINYATDDFSRAAWRSPTSKASTSWSTIPAATPGCRRCGP